MKAMEKFPIIIYAGAAMLAWSAGKMIVEDRNYRRICSKYSFTSRVSSYLNHCSCRHWAYEKQKNEKRTSPRSLKKERHGCIRTLCSMIRSHKQKKLAFLFRRIDIAVRGIS